MKIFISWSGKRSLGVATALREWLPYLFNGIELFVSSEDIRKGKRWAAEVSKELEATNFGIACLTRDNLDAPWLLFESGALSKSVKEASVYTLLADGLRPTDIEGPLSHFQHTMFEKEDFFKLIKSISDAQPQGRHDGVRLRTIFEKFWDDLETAVAKISTAKSDSKPEKTRTVEDMLRELLDTTTHIAKTLPDMRKTAQIDKQALYEDWNKLVALIEARSPFQGAKERWAKFVETIGKKSPFTRTYLLVATGTYLPDGRFMIFFPDEFKEHIGLLDNEKNQRLFRTTLTEFGCPIPSEIAFAVVPSKPPPGPEES